jgi:putative membrane protein
MSTASPSARGVPDPAQDDWRVAYERDLIDADRVTMQIVQTALSLIGFGFTLYAFFTETRGHNGVFDIEAGARRLGLTFQLIGLILVTTGIVQQGAYRRRLWRRSHALSGHDRWAGPRHWFTPCYLSAVLLLGAGLMAMVNILLRWFF